MDKTLLYLNQISDNLEFVDYEMIYHSIMEMRFKAVPVATLPKGSYIDRVRPNIGDEVFMRERQVSYITDPVILNKRKEYGRANLPLQSMFYGSVISSQIDTPRGVAYAETSNLFTSNKLADFQNASEVFTHSRWRVIEDIHLVEIIFSDEALKVNMDLQVAVEYHIKRIVGHEKREHFLAQLKLFSNQFARRRTFTDHEYKISCAYTNYILSERPDLSGIAYPSVASKYMGQNVVLKSSAVDNSLRLESVGMSLFRRENYKNLPIECFKICTDFGENNQKFVWRNL